MANFKYEKYMDWKNDKIVNYIYSKMIMGAWLSYNREFKCDTCSNTFAEIKSWKELFNELLDESDMLYPDIRDCPGCESINNKLF